VQPTTPAFEFFGAAHLVAVVVTLVAPFALAAFAKRFDRVTRITIALILAINFISYGVRACLSGTLQWQQALPFQLCDWTMIGVIVACLTIGGTTAVSSNSREQQDGTAPVPPLRRSRLLEVIYFWGIGGSLQAVLTPNLQFGFPDYRFLTFFVDHCAIVVGVTYLMLTRRFRPTVGSIWRTWLWSIAYLLVTLLVDEITGVNYGFLLHKPEAFSILSYLSDSRPMYILQLNVLALAFFALLYAPFAIADKLKS
jgi:uncharacterized membrane protein YwaF